jgi:FkbM family methyltransferase
MENNQISINKWFLDNGDNTHIIDYEFNENSVIIDLGAYNGLWCEVLLKKLKSLKPKIFLVEPVPEFFNNLVSKFSNNNNIKVLNCGVSIDSKEVEKDLYKSNDASSTTFKVGEVVKINTIPIDKILLDNNINFVDLIQINIEGDEYSLMEYMLDYNLINNFKNIQIQYHLGVDRAIERRDMIRSKLMSNGFKIKFDYPFVWEAWTKF